MVASGIFKPVHPLGLVDFNQVRHNWNTWAGQTTRSWLDLTDVALQQRLSQVSHLKRFLELYCVDPSFRADLRVDPQGAIAQRMLQVDLNDVRSLWDAQWDRDKAAALPLSETVQDFLSFSQEWMDWPELRQIGDRSHHPQFKAWRSRQIARTQWQFSEGLAQRIAHIPVSFELSQGCSVGCYFCGISAPKLEDIFVYTPENAKLWRGILTVLQETLGESASAGFCYWATDPLDNPDYEQFMLDFHAILGVFTQTTTAQPTKDLNRVRSLLKLSFEKGCKLNRFSILSAKILRQVYAEFTPEELLFVGLVPQNREAHVLTEFPFVAAPARKMNAGRLLQRNSAKSSDETANPSTAPNGSVDGTIACVSGFLINLVQRQIKLVSPCLASPENPLGYITFDQRTFSDVASFAATLTEMMQEAMPLSVPPAQPLQWRQGLHYQPLLDGFQLSSSCKAISLRQPFAVPGLLNYAQLGQTIEAGSCTAEEIIQQFEQRGVSREQTQAALNHLFEQGALQECEKLELPG
jgi:radical SAM family RiPP maturation amino acid epimerase